MNILTWTAASQDSRSDLELLPGVLCAQGNATKPSHLWLVTSPSRPSPGALRSGCWNAPEGEHPCRAAPGHFQLGSTAWAAGLLFQPREGSVWAGSTPSIGLQWVRQSRTQDSRSGCLGGGLRAKLGPEDSRESAAIPWTGSQSISILNVNLQMLFVFP